MSKPEFRPSCEGWEENCTGLADVIASYFFTSENGPVQITLANCRICHPAIQINSVGPDGDTRLYFQNTEVWHTFEESK